MFVSRETRRSFEGELVQPSAIFQRTESGRLEIQLKMEGLTQSERLVLIVADGKDPLSELKKKLKGLESVRVERAIKRLSEKRLIFEVLMTPDEVASEDLDPVAVDRFLQQDPLDPVTIVSFDAEYEYEAGSISSNGARGTSLPFTASLIASGYAHSNDGRVDMRSERIPTAASSLSEAPFIANVDFYIPLEKSQVETLMFADVMSSADRMQVFTNRLEHKGRPAGLHSDAVGSRHFAWVFLMAAGLILIVVSLSLKFIH